MRIGIDLGGTKIELAALDDHQHIICRERVATPQGDYEATVNAIVTLVERAEKSLGQRGSVGVGIPGTVSPDHGRIKNANSTCLIGQDLQGDLARRLHRDIRVANDADCFALSEASDGAGEGFATVFGVILGTGTGGGLVCHGRLLNGPNAIAGEWGHNPLPWRREDDGPTRPCYCGKHDCIETFLSGPGLQQTLHHLTGREWPADSLQQPFPAPLDRALRGYTDQLARGLAHVINLIDPWVIVLGGGVSNLDILYRWLPDVLPRYVFSDRVNTPIVRHRHGDSSGVRGAAWLWPQGATSG